MIRYMALGWFVGMALATVAYVLYISLYGSPSLGESVCCGAWAGCVSVVVGVVLHRRKHRG